MYGLRFYKLLLKVYPKSFRQQYGDEMAQVFEDCCRDAYRLNGTRGLIRWWMTGLSDLLLNLVKAWWMHNGKLRFLHNPILVIPMGIITLFSSWIALLWCIIMITVFFLVPWDIGIRPENTLASSVDAFFQADSARIWLPGLAAVGLSVIVFVRGVRSWNPSYLGVYLWRFSLSNLVITVVGCLMVGAGMLALRQLFPNLSTFEGDQSYNIGLVYLGLVVNGCLLVAPLRFQTRLFRSTDELSPDTA